MNSSFPLYACLILLNFCGFFCTLEAGSDLWDPSNILAAKFRTAIDFTSKFPYPGKPLTLYTPLDETCVVNRTSCSITVTLLNKVTVSTMTGGALGCNVYQFASYSFSWKSCQCAGTYEFTAFAIYVNSKYGSYEEAFEKQDGIVIVSVPITTSGNYSNPKFDAYSDFFKCQIRDHQTAGKIKSAYTYTWFVNFPKGGTYHVCKQKYTDPNTGKTTTATVIQLPSDPRVNFISSAQFQIFLKMGDSMGQSSEIGSCSKFETYKGIAVYYLPA